MKDWGRYKKSLEYDTMLYDISLSKFGPNDERVADAARQLARYGLCILFLNQLCSNISLLTKRNPDPFTYVNNH